MQGVILLAEENKELCADNKKQKQNRTRSRDPRGKYLRNKASKFKNLLDWLLGQWKQLKHLPQAPV